MKSDYYDEHLNFSLVKCIVFRFPINDIRSLSLLPKQSTMKRLFSDNIEYMNQLDANPNDLLYKTNNGYITKKRAAQREGIN